MNLFHRYKNFIIVLVFVVIGVFVLLYATKRDDPEKETYTASVSPTPLITAANLVPSPTVAVEDHTGEAISKLTGLWVPEEVIDKRPYAIMFNNIEAANPQSGLSDAAILYEALVEGGITRLMGIYESIDKDSKTATRIGSVRSARHYYASIADEYDAIFIHFGKTVYAVKKMEQLGIDHLDGTLGLGADVFYRDSAIKQPHNAFASLDGILAGISQGKFRTEYEEGYEGHFTFNEEDITPANGEDVIKITLNFSKLANPYFTYDSENKVYKRFQFGGEHIDANTKEPLTYKNLIIQYVKEWNIDKNGYQTMDIEDAKGEGLYITNGKAVKITWVKKESTSFMRYYEEDGDELSLNPGKTYIAVFPTSKMENITFE